LSLRGFGDVFYDCIPLAQKRLHVPSKDGDLGEASQKGQRSGRCRGSGPAESWAIYFDTEGHVIRYSLGSRAGSLKTLSRAIVEAPHSLGSKELG